MAPGEHATLFFAVLAALSLSSGESVLSPSVSQRTYARIGGRNKRYVTDAISTTIEFSPSSCARKCFRNPECFSFNLRATGPDRVTCELLPVLPLSPAETLQDSAGWSYYEKGCRASYDVVGAFDGPVEGVHLEPGQRSVYVGTDGGRKAYAAVFKDDFTLVRFDYLNNVSVLTGGHFSHLDSMAKVTPGNDEANELNVFVQGDKVYITVAASNKQARGFPKTLQDLNIRGTRALLVTRDGLKLFAFRQDEVLTLTFNYVSPDRVTVNVTDTRRLGRSETHEWRLAPSDVMAAAWVNSEAPEFVNSRKHAVLITPDYYVILDVETKKVVKRNQFCRR